MEKEQILKERKQVAKRSMNKNEWTKELDAFLMETVIRNYFKFEIVSLEINQEVKNLKCDFGATNVFTPDKCRTRWSYLHLQRKLGKPIAYRSHSQSASGQSASESEDNKENKNKSNKGQLVPVKYGQVSQPKDALNKKNYSSVTDFQPKTLEEIEQNMWRYNIKKGPRDKSDFLDTSKEDFSQNKSKNVKGEDVTPSSFNIFRDSLRKVSEKMHETLIDNLPDMNLNEIDESESEMGEDTEDEVLPLDFRTALIEKDDKVVIQAKPLTQKSDKQLEREERMKKGARGPGGLDAYLEMVKKESFKEEDGAIMLDPDINIKAKFDEIMMECNKTNFLNNSINAPIRTTPLPEPKKKDKVPITSKTYDTDTDKGSASEDDTKFKSQKMSGKFSIKEQTQAFAKFQEQRNKIIQHSIPKDAVKEKVLKEDDPLAFGAHLGGLGMGINELDELVGLEDEDEKQTESVEKIMDQNREAERKQKEESEAFNQDKMLDSLEDMAKPDAPYQDPNPDEESSDMAPVSPYADMLTQEEEAKEKKVEEQRKFIKSVNVVSSDSEGHGSDTQSKNKILKNIQQKQKPLDTVKEKKKLKTKYYKGQLVMSDTEETIKKSPKKKQKAKQESSEESSSNASNCSADDYFNQQRKNIRKKLEVKKKESEEKAAAKKPAPPKRRELPEESDSSDEKQEDKEDIEFKKRLEQERKQQMEMIKRKKEQAELIQAQKSREAQLLKQQEMIKADQERKQKEKEALMEKLKKQDDERKKRKKAEREEKEREAKRYQAMKEEKARQIQEQKELEQQKIKEQQDEIKRQKWKAEQEEKLKLEIEENVTSEEAWVKAGKSDVPHLFDKKSAYNSVLSALPLDLEKKIKDGAFEKNEMRFKTLMVPLDHHINNSLLNSLITYFMQNSTMHKIYDNEHKSAAFNKECFPFKCLSMQMTVVKAPLSKVGLQIVDQAHDKDYQKNAIRVLCMIFDTKENSKTKGLNIQDELAKVKLSAIASDESISYMIGNYELFIKELAKKYQRAKQVEEFPFKIKSMKQGLVEFENPSDVEIVSSTVTLKSIAFYTLYTKEEGIPVEFKDSWDIFRRQPSFYAFNFNKPTYTKWAPPKKNQKTRVVTKYKSFQFENICVILKDLSYDPLLKCKADSSLSYLLKKSLKEDLDVVGIRMVYLEETQKDEYYKIFYQKIESSSSWDKPVIAVLLRGLDAQTKVESILGHFNPETARNTNQKSLRACFGRSMEDNCVMQIFDQSKQLLSMKFWFGGRVKAPKIDVLNQNKSEVQPLTHQLVVPSILEKQLLLVSPCVPTYKLPSILQRLTSMGVVVLEVQKIDFSQLQYMAGSIESFNRESLQDIRGSQYKIQVGYAIKLARENLASHFSSQSKNLMKDLDSITCEYSLKQLLYMTQNHAEYKKVLQSLKKNSFKVNFNLAKREDEKEYQKKDKDYDSEDPDQYKDINLFETPKKLNVSKMVKQAKKKYEAELYEKGFQVNTCVCFIKISTFKKQSIGETLNAIINQLDLEVLGLRMINAKKELYHTGVPVEVKTIIRQVAYKFHESATGIPLRRKMIDFKTLAIVLRGQDIQGSIDKIYDRERMKFRPECTEGLDDMSFSGTPHTLFITNNETKKPFIDFILESDYIKLYTDLSCNQEHLNNSIDFLGQLQEAGYKQGWDADPLVDAQKFIRIETLEKMMDDSQEMQPSMAVCVIKPNQSFNMVIRALRSIANNINPDGLSHDDPNFVKISDLQMIPSFNQDQIDHLFLNDIMLDDLISPTKKNKMKARHQEIFELAIAGYNPIWQFCVEGVNAMTKLKALIGQKDPQMKTGPNDKGSLRSFYGSDRCDNAFYISETVHESLIDKGTFFEDQDMDPEEEWEVVPIEEDQNITDSTPIGKILSQNKNELALVIMTPTVVRNHDFVFIIDDLNRNKFTIAALLKKELTREDLDIYFKDMVPKVHDMDILEAEFQKGESIIVVVEKTRAVEDTAELIGKSSVKMNSDWEKKKKKQNQGFQFGNNNKFAQSEANNLLTEYGSYIFCFPNPELNKQKISKTFTSLPNTKNFKMQRIK